MGRQLMYDKDSCLFCGRCAAACGNGVISVPAPDRLAFEKEKCVLCGACVEACSRYGAKALGMQGRIYTVEEVMEELLKDKIFYEQSGGGVTFSGGEVLEQIAFAEELAGELQKERIGIACETSGYAPEESMKRLEAVTDLFLFDIKHYDEKRHMEGTGVSNRQILSNLRMLAGGEKEIIARIPIIPGYNDGKTDARRFGELLKGMGIREVNLLPFHQFGMKKYEKLALEYEYREKASVQKEELESTRQILERYVQFVQIGG